MKTLCITLMVLFMTISFTSCKKEASEVDPDFANRVAGRYSLSKFELGGTSYKISDTYYTGSMEVRRESAASVMLIMDVKGRNNAQFLDGTVTGVTLTDVGNGELSLMKDGNNLGRGGNNTLAIRGVDTQGDSFVITGKK
jgi:hypothetical protein